MKKDFMKAMFLMLCAVFAFTFTACSDDDDPADAATRVAGSYNGTLEVFVGGTSAANESKTITLVKNTENSVDLVISNFSITVEFANESIPVNMGNVTIANCVLTGSGDNYTFAGSISIPDVAVSFMGVPVTADCDVSFTNATVNGDNLILPLTVDAKMGETSISEALGGITVNFTGTK